MRARLVAKAHGVHIVAMALYPQNTSLRLQVIHVDAVIGRPRNDLAPVTAESQTPDAKVTTTPPPAASTSKAMSTAAHVGEVQHARLRSIALVGVGKTYLTPNTAVCKKFVIRRKRSIRNRPLAAVVMHCLVVFPIVRVAGVVHPHLEVLPTGEEERAILAELSGVASRVQIDDQISLRARDEILRSQRIQCSLPPATLNANLPIEHAPRQLSPLVHRCLRVRESTSGMVAMIVRPKIATVHQAFALLGWNLRVPVTHNLIPASSRSSRSVAVVLLLIVVILAIILVQTFAELDVCASCAGPGRHTSGLENAAQTGGGEELQDLLLGYCTAAKALISQGTERWGRLTLR